MTISREDLEASCGTSRMWSSPPKMKPRRTSTLLVGGAAVVVVVLVAYGIWRSRSRRIHIEVYQTT